MANERLNIPEKLKIGFQKRTDTYTGKLAYVTYVNKKGEIAKFTSWERWRSKEMDVDTVDNVPTEGFVLNKRVGGGGSGWNHRETKCRIFDPRGFEFEITVENLLFILQECTSTKGKGLEGQFVYAWDGPDLVLLPVGCEDYNLSSELQEKQEKIKVKDLKLGAAYKSKLAPYLIYIGKMEWYLWENCQEQQPGMHYWQKDSYEKIRLVKMSTFVNPDDRTFVGLKSTDKIDYLIDENVITADDVATYVENYKTTEAYKSGDLLGGLGIPQGDLKVWKKYIKEGNKAYNWGKGLLYKRPDMDFIYYLKGEKHYIYEKTYLSQWVNAKLMAPGNKKTHAELSEEFMANAQCEITYQVGNKITFVDGRLRRFDISRNDAEYNRKLNITEDDWQYMCDSEYSKGFFFYNSKGEVVQYMKSQRISEGTVKFNEDAPLPNM